MEAGRVVSDPVGMASVEPLSLKGTLGKEGAGKGEG